MNRAALYQSERQDSAELALTRIESVLSALGLRAVICEQGPGYSHCQLIDAQDQLVSVGSGKGPFHHIGARAEAFEHYILETRGLGSQDQLSTFQDWQHRLHFKRDLLLVDPPQDASLHLETFEDLTTRATVMVPRSYVYPFSHHLSETEMDHRLLPASTNSGCALGASRAEAQLHAIHEIIERHQLSILFLELCGFARGTTWQIVAEDATSLTLLCGTQFSSYFSICFEMNADGPLALFGSGSSLNPFLAIQRAQDELRQAIALNNDEEEQHDKRVAEWMSRFSKVAPLTHWDRKVMGARLSFGPVVCGVKEPAQPTIAQSDADVSLQLKTMQEQLWRAGYRIFRRGLFDQGGIYVEQIHIPELERFQMIRHGSLIPSEYILRSERPMNDEKVML